MKKLFLGLAVIAGSFTLAQQKATAPSSIRFGLKAGLNISSLTKEDGADNKPRIGFNTGAFVNIPLSDRFNFQPEILYSQYGDKTSKTFAGTKYTYTRNLDYITVPVMFQAKVLVPNLYVELGPEFGFLVGSKGKFSANNNSLDGKLDAKSFNLGLGVGAGYYFTDNFGVTARYTVGVIDVIKNNSGDPINNNVVQVGLTYRFK